MGMNMILTIIAGIVMTTMVGTQVAPNIIDQIKVKKTQVQTINNQEVIFEAIKRYTTMKQVAPTSIQDLISAGYLEENVNNNGFGVEHIIDSEKYTIHVDKALGVATITTTIVDPKAQEAFLNSFMGTSKPTRVGTTNNFQTKFVLPNEVMHGNALLMTGIPIQATPPDSNINKYWYDTSSGKAILKLYSGASWIVVDFGAANVKLTGDQTIDGIKTFTSSPKAPTPATSDNSTNIATTMFVQSLINNIKTKENIDVNGWVEFPNGLILQWGRFLSTTHAFQDVSFPKPFPNRVIAILPGGTFQFYDVDNPALMTMTIMTNSYFKANRSDHLGGTNKEFAWVAIGY